MKKNLIAEFRDIKFDGIGYRVSCAHVNFINNEEELIEGHEFRLSKGEITDWGQACYEFKTKEVIQQIWYNYDCSAILSPKYFRINEELRENFNDENLYIDSLEYVENQFRGLLIQNILLKARAKYSENMTVFGRRLGYSRQKISRIENYGFYGQYEHNCSQEEVNRIHKALKIK